MMSVTRVSILTRPEGRVQRRARSSTLGISREFQSSPVPKDGCNVVGVPPPRRADCNVSILTRPEGRVQPLAVALPGCTDVCFNPHPSRRTGATRRLRELRSKWRVSILTRPEGRVQLVAYLEKRGYRVVSILTRPEGRVQRSPNCGCMSATCSFQSSPVPKDGCNSGCTHSPVGSCLVSILTRPEGRVQRFRSGLCQFLSSVSILTRPEGRVQPGTGRAGPGGGVRFNPHPSRRTGATTAEIAASHHLRSFNPHPSRRTGATS